MHYCSNELYFRRAVMEHCQQMEERITENVLKAIDDQPTIEDVQNAINKQIPQKIFHQGYEYEGQMIYPVGINGVPYDLCPNCKTNLCTDGFLGRDKKRMNYCENCGQRLDWTVLEGEEADE